MFVSLCGHNALRSELITTWPAANWVFNEASKGSVYDGMLENFDAGNCGGLVGGKGDLLASTPLMNKFCVRNLVDTNTILLEKPVAFPACKDIVAGISYWMYEAEKRGIVFESYQDASQPPQVCQVSIYDNDADGVQDDLRRLTIANFALPLLTVVLCCLIATILQLRHKAIVYRRRGHFKKDSTSKTNTFRNNEDTTILPTSFDNTFPNNNQQDQHDGDQLFVVQPVLSPILLEDIATPNNPDTILKTLQDLVELLVTQQQQQQQQQQHQQQQQQQQ